MGENEITGELSKQKYMMRLLTETGGILKSKNLEVIIYLLIFSSLVSIVKLKEG